MSASRRSTNRSLPPPPDDPDDEEDRAEKRAIILFIVVMLAIGIAAIWSSRLSKAAEHHHPPEHAQLHDSFYKDLKQPDASNLGCCDNRDCYPTRAKFDGKSWWAIRREDQKWVEIPRNKINAEKSPDGQAHLCAPAPVFGGDLSYVLCFVPPDYPGT